MPRSSAAGIELALDAAHKVKDVWGKISVQEQFDYWRHTQLIIDVVPGRGSGFSADAPEGVRFLTRSRAFTNEEVAELEAAGPPARAA